MIKISKDRISPLQASKWLKIPALLDDQEMSDLLDELFLFYILVVSEKVKREAFFIKKEQFLAHYREYVGELKQGIIPQENKYRALFSSIFTLSLDTVLGFEVNQEEILIRPISPVVQLQGHRIHYSLVDKKFYSMTYSPNSISWGIQFSYPQLFLDPVTSQVKELNKTLEYENSAFFQKIQKWVRKHTIPTPFFVEDKQVNVPFRIGKRCLEWINEHPQLKSQNIKVLV